METTSTEIGNEEGSMNYILDRVYDYSPGLARLRQKLK